MSARDEHAALMAFIRRALDVQPHEPMPVGLARVLRTPGLSKGMRMAAHVLWPGHLLAPSTLERAVWWLRAGAAVAVLLLATGCGSPDMPCSDAGASSSSDASGEGDAAPLPPPFDRGRVVSGARGPRLGTATRGVPTLTPVKLRAHAMMFDEGQTRGAIARALNLAPNTVSKYVADVEAVRRSARNLRAAGVRGAVLAGFLATGCGSPFMPCPDAGGAIVDASGAESSSSDAAPPFDAGAGDAGDATDLDVAQVDAGVEAGAGLCCGSAACVVGAPWSCTHQGAPTACDEAPFKAPPCAVGDPCESDAGAGVVAVCP